MAPAGGSLGAIGMSTDEKAARRPTKLGELVRRILDAVPGDIAKARAKMDAEQKSVEEYVEERRASIRRGARRTAHRFRI